MELGDQIIDFRLKGTDGEFHSLKEYADKKVIAVVFSCNHCPYVIASERELVALQSEFGPKGFQLIAINSNEDKNYPQDSFEEMVRRAKEKGFNFPYLRDETQEVAKAYGAGRTPEFFIFDEHHKLRYHGRINDNPREHDKITRHDAREAIAALLEGRDIEVPITNPIGCSIKWWS
ncbi:MAG: thioredoxin family protein [Methanobacteriota archaeon]|nr:MAG: thioredoxin family protein [Euryarchaeota archaeon]